MQDQWVPEHHYHLIGKAIPGRTLFRDEAEHMWFLKKVLRFKWYAFFEIYAYCLCGNHFHLCVRTRPVDDLVEELELRPHYGRSELDERYLRGELPYAHYVWHAFAGSLSGFARHTNSVQQLGGQVLIEPTLHGLTDKGAPGHEFSRRLCAYVGLNYVKHGLGTLETRYRWSSLHSNQFKLVERAMLYEHFDGEEAYRTYHRNYLRRFGQLLHAFDEDRFFDALTPRRQHPETGVWELGEWRPSRTEAPAGS